MSPTILFIADAGAQVGGGHVMRSLTLARALQAQGATPVFLSSPEVDALLDAFAPDMARTPAPTQRAFDAVVFDHYGLSASEHTAIAHGRATLVIDDLADRPLAADLVLDAGPHRTPADYAAFAPGAELLLGPAYAPVRPQFAQARPAALARRAGPANRALIALGLTDLGAITARVAVQLRQAAPDLALDVVLGSGAPSLAALRPIAAADPAMTLHVDTSDMADLTAAADIAVGAAGSTTWERCVLGLPSILLVLAANQQITAQAMAQRHAALVIDVAAPDFARALDRDLARLLAEPALRAALSQASAALCDGRGADRVAAAFLARIAAKLRLH